MEPEQKSNGALIGIIIIVIILVVGGIYLWRNSTSEQPVPPANVGLDQNTQPTDPTSSAEANLNSLDLENLDKGL